jgi:hypothetical protein
VNGPSVTPLSNPIGWSAAKVMTLLATGLDRTAPGLPSMREFATKDTGFIEQP